MTKRGIPAYDKRAAVHSEEPGRRLEAESKVRAICNHYNIDCIELHDIDKKSGHPSIKGMEQISEQIKTVSYTHLDVYKRQG